MIYTFVLEKSRVKGHYATQHGKRVWVKEYERSGGEQLLEILNNLLNKIKGLKKQGQFTKEQRLYARKKLKEIEPKLKHFKQQKQRAEVFKVLKEIRLELDEKTTLKVMSKDRKSISDKFRQGLKRLGYNIKDIQKLSSHEIQTIYYNEILR
jgi:formyltetrahydrofolate synthetase